MWSVVALLVGGCSDGEHHAPEQRDKENVYSGEKPASDPQASDSPIQVSAFDAYALTPEQQAVVRSAEDSLIAECMSKAGFEYQPEDSAPEPVKKPAYDPHWGPLDPVMAAEHGYYDPTSLEALLDGKSIDPNADARVEVQETVSAKDRAYGEALYGTEGQQAGGCSGEADGRLGLGPGSPDWARAIAAVDRLRSSAGAAAMNDDAIDKAVGRWATCMRKQGFSYSSPQAAKSDTWSRDPERRELATAKADAECKAQVDLMGTLKRTELAYELKAADEGAVALKRMRTLQRRVLKAAEEVLAEGR